MAFEIRTLRLGPPPPPLPWLLELRPPRDARELGAMFFGTLKNCESRIRRLLACTVLDWGVMMSSLLFVSCDLLALNYQGYFNFPQVLKKYIDCFILFQKMINC